MAELPVNRIIPASAVDGPGNRAAVFVQGCNRLCAYCHNPETRQMCISCGLCVPVCPAGALTAESGRISWNGARCIRCDGCIRACPHSADPRAERLTAETIMARLAPALPFIEGLTLSGGECTLYPEAAAELARAAHAAGKTFFVDTNGARPLREWRALADAMDMAMVDIKAHSGDAYRALTGCAANAAADTVKALAEEGRLYEVRTVIAPGVMDAEATVRLAATLTAPYPAVIYKLIRYRAAGVKQPCPARTPTDAELEELKRTAAGCGKTNVTVI